jgi:hypothetical protein
MAGRRGSGNRRAAPHMRRMLDIPVALLRVFGWAVFLMAMAGPLILGGLIAPVNALAGALVAGVIIETMPKNPGKDAG